MASSVAVPISTTAVELAAPAGSRRSVAIYNVGANSVYYGGSDVSSSNGLLLASGGYFTITLGESEHLYAVCATAESATLRVLTAVA